MKYMAKSIEELHTLLKEGKVTSKELIKEYLDKGRASCREKFFK